MQPEEYFSIQNLLELVDETEAHKPTTFLVNTFFPAGQLIEGADINVDTIKGSRRSAAYVLPAGEGQTVQRDGYKSEKFTPPYLKPLMVTEAGDILAKPAGARPFGFKQSGQDLANMRIGHDSETLMDMIRRNWEVQARDAFVDAKVFITGDNVPDRTIDYGRDADHDILNAGTDEWTDYVGSDPLADLYEDKRLIRKKTGFDADFVVMSNDVFDIFINHPKVKEFADNRRFDLMEATFIQNFGSHKNVDFHGKTRGLNIVTYDGCVDDALGVPKELMPEKTYVMGVSGGATQNNLHFGVIQDLKAPGGSVAREIFLKTWQIDNPSKLMVQAQSAPLVVAKRPDTTVKRVVYT